VSNRQKRKRKQRATPKQPPTPAAPSRSEQRNAEARAALVPLAEGERPTAVTVGAIVALLFGLSNFVMYAIGTEIRGQEPNAGVLVFGALMLWAAWGMWKMRYWAVLGMQALLALIIVAFSISAMTISSVWGVVIVVGVVGAAGTLFWFMVKAMARIQMPRRDQ
jgi:cation transport ATPase